MSSTACVDVERVAAEASSPGSEPVEVLGSLEVLDPTGARRTHPPVTRGGRAADRRARQKGDQADGGPRFGPSADGRTR